METTPLTQKIRKSSRISKSKSWNEESYDDAIFEEYMRTLEEEEEFLTESKYL
jgi:hypothetical protein